MRKIFLLAALITGFSFNLLAQNLGEWQVYPSYSTVNGISVTDDAIYSATLGGIYITEGNEITEQISTMDGLYRSNPTAIIYDEENEVIFAGYIDGTIDVVNLAENSVTALKDINRVSRFNSRTINAFQIYEGSLYVATSFGIVVYNLEQYFVENSFTKLGEFNAGIQVNHFDIIQDTIYAATEMGVAIGGLNDNLVESGNWETYNTSDGFNANTVQQVAWFNGNVYALSQDSLFTLQADMFVLNEDFENGEIRVITRSPDAGKFVAATNSVITIVDEQNSVQTLRPDLGSPVTVLQVRGDQIYVGTTNEGIFVLDDINADPQKYLPTGPYLNFFNNLMVDGNVLVATSSDEFPGRDPLNPVRGYYIFEDNTWENFNVNTNQVLRSHWAGNVYSVGQTDSAYFLGSWGAGVIKHQKSTGEVSVYDQDNSTFVGIAGSPHYVVISGLDSDAANNIWAVSYWSEFPLNVQLAGTEEWIPFRSLSGDDLYYKLLIDSYYDQKWISLISSNNTGLGLLIVDTGDPEDPDDDQAVKLRSDPDNGNLPDDKINAIVEDKSGEIWIGTGRGIARFIFPEPIIEGGSNEAQWLINEDTTASSRFLLRDVNVSSIAVNDANQKWVGSQNQGLWLLNAEGSRIERRITAENSNLISDNIESIAINSETGQVYIATDLGLVSFQDVPLSPVRKMDKLKVFPNPFEYNRHSQIVIEGLSEATQIKILGVDGVVVNELEATGGRVSWDGHDYNGNQLGTGVYFVVAYENSGRERGMGKVVIVR